MIYAWTDYPARRERWQSRGLMSHLRVGGIGAMSEAWTDESVRVEGWCGCHSSVVVRSMIALRSRRKERHIPIIHCNGVRMWSMDVKNTLQSPPLKSFLAQGVLQQ